MPYETKVTLVGTWEREETTPGEVTSFRKTLRGAFAEARGLSGYFTARHPENKMLGRYEPQTRRGDFRIVLDVPDMAMDYMKEVRLTSRASTMLRWFITDATCRPPTLTIDRAKSTATRRYVTSL